MAHEPPPWVVFFAVFLAIAVWKYRREIMDALRNFRGGPPRPTHPSPAADSAFVRRKRANGEL